MNIWTMTCAALFMLAWPFAAGADPTQEVLDCLEATEFEAEQALACIDTFSDQCLQGMQGSADYASQSACFRSLSDAVRQIEAGVEARAKADPKDMRAGIVLAVLRYANRISEAECLLFRDLPHARDMSAQKMELSLASCRAISDVTTYWAVIVHDQTRVPDEMRLGKPETWPSKGNEESQ